MIVVGGGGVGVFTAVARAETLITGAIGANVAVFVLHTTAPFLSEIVKLPLSFMTALYGLPAPAFAVLLDHMTPFCVLYATREPSGIRHNCPAVPNPPLELDAHTALLF